VPNGGRRCEYDDINFHDVVMLEIPWLCGLRMEVPYPTVALY
jgi:hypothetical protein